MSQSSKSLWMTFRFPLFIWLYLYIQHIPTDNHFLLFCLSFIFFCSFIRNAKVAPDFFIWEDCPSHIIGSPSYCLFCASSNFIFSPCPPKISGLFILKFDKFLVISTSAPPSLFMTPWGWFFCPPLPRQFFRCLLIYDDRMCFLQMWHCWSNYFRLGSDIIFSSRFLL